MQRLDLSLFALRWEAYKTRGYLAAIDHNHHSQRAQESGGKPCYRRKWLRRSKRWTAVPVLVAKNYDYIPQLMLGMATFYAEDDTSIRSASEKSADDPRLLASTIAAVPPQPVITLAEQHRS